MDELRQNDITLALATLPGEKLRQALDLMDVGFRLKRSALRARHPEASEQEIARMFEEWLMVDD